jgi:hypothetical protein
MDIMQFSNLRSNWRIEDLEEATDVIEKRFMSLKKAS